MGSGAPSTDTAGGTYRGRPFWRQVIGIGEPGHDAREAGRRGGHPRDSTPKARWRWVQHWLGVGRLLEVREPVKKERHARWGDFFLFWEHNREFCGWAIGRKLGAPPFALMLPLARQQRAPVRGARGEHTAVEMCGGRARLSK